MLSRPILTCHTKEFSTTDFTDTIDISGRCVLHYVWSVPGIGWGSSTQGDTVLLDFKSGGSSGESVLKCPLVVTQFADARARIGLGSGGILFPDGIYVKPNASAADVGAITLLYEQG
jgi:hypothetical protein